MKRLMAAAAALCLLCGACSAYGEPPAATSPVAATPSSVDDSSTTLVASTTSAAAPSSTSDDVMHRNPCEAGPVTETVTTITLWSTLNVDAELVLEELIVRFNALHSNLQVDLQYTEDPLTLLYRLRNGERPDLLIMGIEGLINLDDSGMLTDAAECIANDPAASIDDLLPVAAATYQLGGRQIAMPLSVSTPVLYYDRARVRAAGLDPDQPPTDLADLGRQIDIMKSSGVVTDGLTYGDATWFVTQLAAQHGIPLTTADNGHDRPADEVRATLTDSGLSEVLAPLGELGADGLITPPVRNESGFDDLLRLIDRERPAAMALHTSGAASRVYELIDNDPSSTVEVGVARMPGPAAGSLVGGSALWITTSDPAKAWQAWTLTRFLTDADQQARFAELGYAPARLSAVDVPALQEAWAQRPGLRVAYDVLVGVTPTPATLSVAVGTQSDFVWRLNWAAEDIITGRDPAEALADAEYDINTLLATYDSMR